MRHLINFFIYGIIWICLAFIGKYTLQIQGFSWIMIWGILSSIFATWGSNTAYPLYKELPPPSDGD